MERKEFRLNEVIFKNNVYQNWMYSICEGSVDIYSEYGTAEEKKLITLKKGQFFGEIGMIAVMPRTATAVAAEDCVVLEQITHADLEDYLKNHPEHLLTIMRSVSARIRELTEDLSAAAKAENEAMPKNTGWLEGFINKLMAKKTDMEESAILNKRQQALSGENSSLLRLRAGDVIFRAGEQTDCLYDIYDGQVGIYSEYRTENEKLLSTLYVDEVFGEMGILDDMPRSATAVCLTDCVLHVVKPEDFMKFFQEKPAKVLQILQRMCFQLRELSRKYLQICKEQK